MLIHRINLAGPWHVLGCDRATEVAHAVSARVRFPVNWQALFESESTSIEMVRGFHRPTSLDAHDRVYLVFEGLVGNGTIRLNDVQLRTFSAAETSVAVEVTQLLQPFNRTRLKIEPPDELVADTPAGTVAIEIHAGEDGHF